MIQEGRAAGRAILAIDKFKFGAHRTGEQRSLSSQAHSISDSQLVAAPVTLLYSLCNHAMDLL